VHLIIEKVITNVSSGIPDDWVQESFVSIANDNTYNYNVTYSKNK
jgi:hypothetical protein